MTGLILALASVLLWSSVAWADWKFKSFTDPITDEVAYEGVVRHLGYEDDVQIHVKCSESKKLTVYIFNIVTGYGLESEQVIYRFDKNEPIKTEWRAGGGVLLSVVASLPLTELVPSQKAFIDGMLVAKKLVIRISTADWLIDLGGNVAALRPRVLEHCGW